MYSTALSVPPKASESRKDAHDMDDNMECGCMAIVGIALLILLVAVVSGSELGGLAFLALLVLGAFIYGTRNT